MDEQLKAILDELKAMRAAMATKDDLQAMAHNLETRFAKAIETAKEQLVSVINGNGAELHNDLVQVNVRLDSVDRKLALQAGVLSHMVVWSDRVEDEVIRLSAELATVKERLEKLENPPSAA
jgi:uncharacterized protein YydD (DUF2326 family)